MARIRSIHPKALESRKLRKATAEAERVYWRLQVHCDDDGRCEDDVDLLADMLFPAMHMTPEAVDNWLWELAELGLIARFVGEGVGILQIIKWKDFQHPQKPTPSKLAGYKPGTERSRSGTGLLQDRSGSGPVRSGVGGDIGDGGTADEVSDTQPVDNFGGNGGYGDVEAVRAQRLAIVPAAKRQAKETG